ncbi:hypothetical protein ATJ88_3330 [Isoptericola jiangsuensis]|uniref:Uncharacterized protein n=1 Tax=Isoptericola jiangsuensis TaxID=548579 RepID=A0A2A9F254_9MICO|nr:hypothetical protein [Isoptericola jiangsuensis]PFG44600.1 hypothetical protein ATJ88_3330 [Isoptericola jiangsuensis]
MAADRRRPDDSRAQKLENPVMLGGAIAVALAFVGAFAGFDLLGDVLGVPVLVVVIVAVFVVGAVVTARRIAALRNDGDEPGGA